SGSRFRRSRRSPPRRTLRLPTTSRPGGASSMPSRSPSPPPTRPRSPSGSVDGPRGHGSRPASDEELVRKWNRLTGGDGAALLDTLREARDDEPLATVLPPAVGAVTPG